MLPCLVLGNISITHVTLVSILRIGKPAFYLLIISSFVIFWSNLRIRSAERIRGIGGNFESLRCKETRANYSLSILVSREP